MATIPTDNLYAQNGIEFYVGMEDYDATNTPHQMVGASSFSGAGTTAERDARFPSVANMPEGICWANAGDNLFQIVTGAAGARAWQNIASIGAWANKGSRLTLDGRKNDSGGTLDFYSDSDTTAGSPASSVRFYEVDATVDPAVHVEAGKISATSIRTTFDGPEFTTEETDKYFGRIEIVGNNGAADTRGKLRYTRFVGAAGGPTGTSVSLTPGELDAGTLGGLDLAGVLARSVIAIGSRWSSVVDVGVTNPLFDPAVGSALSFSGGGTGTVSSWNSGTSTLVWEKPLGETEPAAAETVTSSVAGQEPATLGAVVYVDDVSGGGSFRIGEGAATLLVQWPTAAAWSYTTGTSFERTYTYTFPIAYASAPEVVGSTLYTYSENGVQSGYETITAGTFQSYITTATSVSYLTDKRTGGGSSGVTTGKRERVGIPLFIGVPA